MLTLALTFELRSLLRSRASVVALLGFLAVGALAIFVGERHVAQWQEEVEKAEQAEATSVEEARGYFDRGESGPEDKPWINLSEPSWQDQFAGSRIVREPAPLAGVAAGAVDSAPAAFLINRWARPMSAGGYRIENPELASGAVDLAFVLTVLVPLLVCILGLGIGTRERESGIAPFIVVQAGAMRGWVVARMLAVAGIAGAASTVLCLAAGVIGGASVGETAALIAFALLYAALWSGLLLAVNARATTVRAAAYGFGVIWTVLCVLVPALVTEIAFAQVEQDFAVAETVQARTQRWAVWERDFKEILGDFYGLYPDLDPLSWEAVEKLPRQKQNVVRGAIEAALFAGRLVENLEQEREARILTERVAWLSPTVAITLGLERLAGVGADAGFAYRNALDQAVKARVEWVVHKTWANQPLTASDFEALVTSTPSSFQAPRDKSVGPVLALIVWTIFAWGIAMVGLNRTERQKNTR